MATSQSFEDIKRRVDDALLNHPVVTSNDYCNWFEKGDLTEEDVRRFTVQFSVFSNLFLIAQLNKVINSDSLESMRSSKEILANELGVLFSKRKFARSGEGMSDDEKDDEGDPDLVGTDGSIEGSTFRFKAAHFEWLLRFGEPLGLKFGDVGQRKHGWPSTLFFCDELARLYGQGDNIAGLGASYAVENWAAAGFWKQLISGLTKFKQQAHMKLPLAFFTWHDKVEDNHAAHTHEELAEVVSRGDFDTDAFIAAGMEMLEGVNAFWDGLEQDRIVRRYKGA